MRAGGERKIITIISASLPVPNMTKSIALLSSKTPSCETLQGHELEGTLLDAHSGYHNCGNFVCTDACTYVSGIGQSYGDVSITAHLRCLRR